MISFGRPDYEEKDDTFTVTGENPNPLKYLFIAQSEHGSNRNTVPAAEEAEGGLEKYPKKGKETWNIEVVHH